MDVIINVVDASSLERNLYLTLQLLELKKPVILALNMMDIIEERGMEIDLHRLPEMLGEIPVVPVSARKRTGLDVLMHAVVHHYEEGPQGVLEGAIPLSLANSGIRAALGKLFTWKLGILLAVVALSVVFYRPFCKWLCPLGAFYALFNRVSLFQMKVDENKCISCGKCARACKMDVDVTKTPNHTECIRCGMCVSACPTGAVSFRYGFGDGKQNINIEENTEEST